MPHQQQLYWVVLAKKKEKKEKANSSNHQYRAAGLTLISPRGDHVFTKRPHFHFFPLKKVLFFRLFCQTALTHPHSQRRGRKKNISLEQQQV